jgi:hypothetical protein
MAVIDPVFGGGPVSNKVINAGGQGQDSASDKIIIKGGSYYIRTPGRQSEG